MMLVLFVVLCVSQTTPELADSEWSDSMLDLCGVRAVPSSVVVARLFNTSGEAGLSAKTVAPDSDEGDDNFSSFMSGERGAAAVLSAGEERLRLDETQDDLLSLAARLLSHAPLRRAWGLDPPADHANGSRADSSAISRVGWMPRGGPSAEGAAEGAEWPNGERPPGAMLLAQLSYMRSCQAQTLSSGRGAAHNESCEGGARAARPAIYTPASLRLRAPFHGARPEAAARESAAPSPPPARTASSAPARAAPRARLTRARAPPAQTTARARAGFRCCARRARSSCGCTCAGPVPTSPRTNRTRRVPHLTPY